MNAIFVNNLEAEEDQKISVTCLAATMTTLLLREVCKYV